MGTYIQLNIASRYPSEGLCVASSALLGVSFFEAQRGQKGGGHPSAVRASGPTARPAHASAQLIDADLDAALPSLFFLGRRDPTDPFVSRQWSDIDPEALRSGIGFYGFPDICWQFVHRAARDPLSSHTLNRACFAQRDRDKPLRKLSRVGFIDSLDARQEIRR